MGTLGNKPATAFQELKKQSITGSGATSYALDYAVTNANDLEVFVNNVRQEPTTAYTISGQNIVMSEAIANTDSFYVIYQAQSIQSVVPPDNSVTNAMLNADVQTSNDTRYAQVVGDTFTGDTVVATTTGTPFRIENTAANNAGAYLKIRDGNSTAGQHTWIGRSGDGTYMYSNNNDLALSFTNAGQVKMQNQPGFSYLGSKSYVISGTGIQAMSSSNVWASNVNHAFNRGSHFNASTGRFTCPIAGRYQFHFKCQASDFGSGYLWFYMRLNQSTFAYSQKSQENSWTCQYLGGILELNANDYVDVAWTNNYVSGQIHMPEFSGMLIG